MGDKYTSEEDRLTYALFGKVGLKFFETRGQPAPASKPAAAKTAPASAQVSPAAPGPQGGSSVYQVRVNEKDFTVEVAIGGSGTMAPAPAAAAPAAAPAPSATAPAPASGGGTPLTAPLPGSIFSLKSKVGDVVNPGDTVLIMESMKMESEVKAQQGGTIQSILVKEGDNVQTGDQLAIIG